MDQSARDARCGCLHRRRRRPSRLHRRRPVLLPTRKGGWWVVDKVNDRGRRSNDIAKFSTFELAEKYLIWDWALFTRNSLSGVEPIGPELYKQGYCSDVSVVPTDEEWRIEVKTAAGSAILGEPDSVIFSYFMSKTVDEIEHAIGNVIER